MRKKNEKIKKHINNNINNTTISNYKLLYLDTNNKVCSCIIASDSERNALVDSWLNNKEIIKPISVEKA